MTIEDVKLHQGFPDQEAVLNLLNEAFGDWGDARFLEWKYGQYPGYEPEHNFYLSVNDELAAFRRLFDKEIVAAPGQKYDFFVHGDTCVASDYQGEGMYSRLYSETNDFCKERNRGFSCTFNQVGKITYEAQRDWGWSYRTLPVYLRILSPEAVLRQYAQPVLEDAGLFTRVLDQIGHRVGFSFDDGQLRMGELAGNQYMDSPSTIYVPLPESVVTILVEAVSRENTGRAIRRRISQRSRSANQKERVTTIRRHPFEDEFVDALHALYTSAIDGYDLHFRRSKTDIHHMLSHPQLESVVTAERDGELLGAAPVCFDTNDGVLEAQILDLVIQNESILQKLLQRVESLAVDNNADLVVAVTDHELGGEWARIDQQVMMWDEYEGGTAPFAEQSLRVGLYDIV
jgi:GNAT superfamily N-acetyltransferase